MRKFIYRGYRSAFKKQSLFWGTSRHKLRWWFEGYEAPLTARSRIFDSECTKIAGIYFLLLSMKISKISPFAHPPLRAAEAAGLSTGSFHKG